MTIPASRRLASRRLAPRHLAFAALPLLAAACAGPESDASGEVTLEANAPTDVRTRLTTSPEWESTLTGFSNQLIDHIAEDDVGGIAVGVVAGGSLVWSAGFGWADREERRPVDQHTVFRTASVSKAVTAMVMLRLVDQGRIALDDPVEPWLPEIERVAERRAGDPPVTFRHLASHTSGFGRNYEVGLAGEADDWQEETVRGLLDVTFVTPPGTSYQDSPIGYAALGLALERVAGVPFTELARAEVFGPLGMASTSYAPDENTGADRLAAAYPNRRNGEMATAGGLQAAGGGGYLLPASGLYSTVHDLALLLRAWDRSGLESLLSAGAVEAFTTVQTPGGLDPVRPAGYPPTGPRPAAFRDGAGGQLLTPEVLDPPQALGVALHVEDGRGPVLHTGGIASGYTAYLAWDPATSVGVIMLRNYWRGSTDMRDGTLGLVSQLNALALGERRPGGDPTLPTWAWIALALLAGYLLSARLGRAP